MNKSRNFKVIVGERDFTRNRSDKYQPTIVESPCAPELLTEFAEIQSISGLLNDAVYNEEFYNLKDQLRIEFWRIVDTQLTTRQKEVIHLLSDGYTQIEIAKVLKVNQSSINKSLNGNCDYRNGKRIYGGAKRKLKRIISKDNKVQLILKRIAELQDDVW